MHADADGNEDVCVWIGGAPRSRDMQYLRVSICKVPRVVVYFFTSDLAGFSGDSGAWWKGITTASLWVF
jgi:hypothetical protein